MVRCQYSYSSLKHANSIRLLTLLPSLQFNDDLVGSIQEVLLDENTIEFSALSYTWGPLDTPKRLIVQKDGHDMLLPIGANLDVALRYLRDGRQPLCLWIDAVCMNQQDLDEKGTQVAMMGKIYSNAKKVLGWIGPSTKESTLAFSGLEILAREMCPNAGLPSRLIGFDDQTIKAITLTKDVAESIVFPAKIRDGLIDLASREWFTRLWIVQETALSHVMDLCCGHDRIDFEVFAAALHLVTIMFRSDCHFTRSLNNEERNAILIPWRLVNIRAMIKMSLSHSLKEVYLRSLFSFMEELRDSRCQDPLDHVYALAGLPSSSSSYAYNILPDYTITPDVLYTTLARTALSNNDTVCLSMSGLWYRNLCNLFQNPKDFDPLELPFQDQHVAPSWVPEYRTERLISEMSPEGMPWLWDKVTVHTGHRESTFTFKTEDLEPTVHIRGVLVSLLNSVLVARNTSFTDLGPCLQTLETTRQGEHLSFNRADVTLIKTILLGVSNMAWHNEPDIKTILASVTNEEELRRLWNGFCTHFIDSKDFPQQLDSRRDRSMREDFISQCTNELVELYWLSLIFLTAVDDWVLFTTTSGHVGIGPLTAKNPAAHYLMKPLATALVRFAYEGCPHVVWCDLRNDKKRLLGPCFVDGLMAWQTEFADDEDFDTIFPIV